MPRFAANLTMMFNEVDFLQRFDIAAKAGFKGVEYLFPYDYEVDHIVEKLQSNKLTQVLHNLPAGNWDEGDRGIACIPDRVGEFRDGVGNAIEYASALGCHQVNCLVGIPPANAKPDKILDTLISNLKFGASALSKKNITLLIEPINTIDMPGFYLTNTTQSKSIIHSVGSDNLKLQYDIYHMQIMEGDITRTMSENLDIICHIQIADNPGRNEPGTGEINYSHIFNSIDRMGYDGWIGCEYKPLSTTLEGLGWLENYIHLI